MGDRFDRIADSLKSQAELLKADNIKPEVWTTLLCVAAAIKTTEGDTDPVPELPEHVITDMQERVWFIYLNNGSVCTVPIAATLDDLDRIAEAARILAARERARRAGR